VRTVWRPTNRTPPGNMHMYMRLYLYRSGKRQAEWVQQTDRGRETGGEREKGKQGVGGRKSTEYVGKDKPLKGSRTCPHQQP